MNNLNDNDLKNIINAVILVRNKIQWKPNKEQSHLLKRIKLGHLPRNASLITYEEIIQKVIFNPESQLYIFRDNDFIYPTITFTIETTMWLVMFSIDGIMETAFPPSNPQKYLSNNSFICIGSLKEFL